MPGKNPTTKTPEDWLDWYGQVTVGFIQHFCLQMRRNEWVLYGVLAACYNTKQERAWPSLVMLESALPFDRFTRNRSMRKLVDLGLVEVIAEKVGRRWRTFYRMLHVRSDGRHVATQQQKSFEELERLYDSGMLPESYKWLKNCHLKSHRHAESDD
jgi:hypothetical protein